MPLVITPAQLAAIAGRSTKLMPALADWMNRLCPQQWPCSALVPAHCYLAPLWSH